mgnify:CR=1 FL=1
MDGKSFNARFELLDCFDIDDTICTTNNKDYINSMPYYDMIERINYLHDSGNKIILFTARGMGKFNGDVKKVYEVYFDLTTNQLKEWGVKFDNLYLGKPSFDYFIDDKNLLISEFKSIINPKIGFIAGSFDVIHPGYIKMFKDIKQKCNHLLVALQIDPSIDRVEKIKPIFDSNCISCHSSPPINGSGISLTTYNSVKSSIENTNLIDRINWQPGQSGFMPLGGSRLPQNLIDLIIQWQLEGFIE